MHRWLIKKLKKKPQNVLLFKVGQRQTDFTRVQHLNVETTAVNLSAAPLSLAVASRSQPIGGGLGRIPQQPQVGSGGGADGGASLCRSYWWRRSSGETVLSLPRPFLLLPGTLGSGTAYSPPTTTGRKEWVRHGQVAETFFGEKKPPPNHQSWRRGEGASTLVFTLSVLVEVGFFLAPPRERRALKVWPQVKRRSEFFFPSKLWNYLKNESIDAHTGAGEFSCRSFSVSFGAEFVSSSLLMWRWRWRDAVKSASFCFSTSRGSELISTILLRLEKWFIFLK